VVAWLEGGRRRHQTPMQAPIGNPPPRPLATVTTSAVTPWAGEPLPHLRPIPVCTSSSHSKRAALSRRSPGPHRGSQSGGDTTTPASPWIGSSSTAAVSIGHRGIRAHPASPYGHEGDLARQGARTAPGRPPSRSAPSAPIVRPWKEPSMATTRCVRPVRRVSLNAASLASVPELVKKTLTVPGGSRGGRAASRRARPGARW
jgi:hypothetical protein